MPTIEVTSNIAEVVRALGKMRQDLRDPALKQAAKEISNATLKEYRRTTATWSHKPKFETLTEVQGGELTQVTGTDDTIYTYVDLGTGKAGGWRADDYPIVPHGNYPLKFRAGYKAKTTPGTISSHAGGPFGAVVRARKVMHPGIKARNFSQSIQRYMSNRSAEIILKYIRKWAAKKYV